VRKHYHHFQRQSHRQKSIRNGGGGGIGSRGVFGGIYHSESRSYSELRHIDTGKLILTNQNLIFQGSFEIRLIPLRKVLGTVSYLDSLEVSQKGRKKRASFSCATLCS
jgi:hypothetical protein